MIVSRFELVPLQGFYGNRSAISVFLLNGRQVSWLQEEVGVGVGLFRKNFCVFCFSDRGLVERGLKWRFQADAPRR